MFARNSLEHNMKVIGSEIKNYQIRIDLKKDSEKDENCENKEELQFTSGSKFFSKGILARNYLAGNNKIDEQQGITNYCSKRKYLSIA
jgi:hypothetical protein